MSSKEWGAFAYDWLQRRENTLSYTVKHVGVTRVVVEIMLFLWICASEGFHEDGTLLVCHSTDMMNTIPIISMRHVISVP